MSYTEAEFVAASDVAKAILYILSISKEINVPQDGTTTLFIENNCALLIPNAQQPICRTRHVDIRHFALLDWMERDLLMKRINTSDDYSDSMTKPLGCNIHNRHNGYILGKVILQYAAIYNIQQSHITV